MNRTAAVAVLCAAVVLAGCARVKRTPDQVLRVNGEWVLASDVDKVAQMLQQQTAAQQPSAAIFGGGGADRRNAARQMVANKLLAAEAQTRGFSAGDSLVEVAWKALSGRYGSAQRFAQELAKAGQTEAALRDNMREGLLIDTLLKSLMSPRDSVTTDSCRSYYERNPGMFVAPGRMRARQLLVAVDTAAGEQQQARAQARAEGLLARARKGEDLGALSRSGKGVSGGDIGWFRPGDLMKELNDIIVPLPKGGFSPVARSRMGFHIFQKTEEEAPQQLSFDKVRDQLRASLEVRARMQFVEAHIDSLIKAARVECFDSAYAPLNAALTP